MSSENEFAQYSVEKLTRMASQFKKRQQIIMIIGVTAAAIIGFMAIGSGNTGMYPVAGLLIVMGVGYPLMSLGPIRKKIQEALEAKQST